jgi:hypothetical protein
MPRTEWDLLQAAIMELQKRVGSLEISRVSAETDLKEIKTTLAEIVAIQYRLEKILKGTDNE